MATITTTAGTFLPFLLLVILGGNFANGQTCFVKGECTESLLLGQVDSPDERDCVQKCQNNTDTDNDCYWFTYDPNFKTCELFQDCKNLSVDACPECISGEVSCQSHYCGVPGVCQVLTIIDTINVGFRLKVNGYYF